MVFKECLLSMGNSYKPIFQWSIEKPNEKEEIKWFKPSQSTQESIKSPII